MLKLKDFYGYDTLASAASDLSDEQKKNNLEMVDIEIESVKSILNEQEFQVVDKEDVIDSNDEQFQNISKVFRLSLIPNSNRKFVIVDEAKGITVELRCLPAIEVYIAIPDAYSSNLGKFHQSN